MKRFRSILFWCHLVTGVAVAVVVFVMSATGVLLTYQRQLTAWADTRGMHGEAPSLGMVPLPIETLLAGVRRTVPQRPTAITWRAERDAPVELAYGRGRTVFVNAYTAAVLGEGSSGARRVFRVVTDWHRWLGVSGPGRVWARSLTGASNLGFLFLVVSGAYLWLPRHWTRRVVRNVSLFRRGLRGKARDFNWHNVIGLWSVLPLLVVVASGVVISYRWANALVYRAVGDPLPAVAEGARPPAPAPVPRSDAPGASPSVMREARAAAFAGLDGLREQAARRVPGWRSMTLAVPATVNDPARFTIDRGTGGEPQKIAQLTLQRATGRELAWQPFSTRPPGQRARAILRFAHTGEVLGVVGQTIAGLASLAGVMLVYTGLMLSWRRLSAWRRRRARGPRRAIGTRTPVELTTTATP